MKTKKQNITVKIKQDTTPDSPRSWDRFGTIAYKHNRYSLVHDEEITGDQIDWLIEKLNYTESYANRLLNQYGYSDELFNILADRFKTKFIALDVFIYDHSGVAFKTTPFGDRWDSGRFGFIYATKEEAKKEFGTKYKQKALNFLEGEIETYNQWASGDVYGFEIEDDEENILDSCWGFYGDDVKTNGMLEHIDFEGYGYTKEEFLELLEKIEIEY